MKIKFDPEADALYIAFREEKPHHTIEICEYVLTDFDSNNYLIGFEILFATKTLAELNLKDFSFEVPNYPQFQLQLPAVSLV